MDKLSLCGEENAGTRHVGQVEAGMKERYTGEEVRLPEPNLLFDPSTTGQTAAGPARSTQQLGKGS